MPLKFLLLFRKPWVRKLLIAAGAALAVFLLLNDVALPLYVNHGGTLSVPNVSGLPLADARAQLEGAGLQPIEADTRPDPGHPPGTVIYQNPPSQALVKHGRRVYLTVSGGGADATEVAAGGAMTGAVGGTAPTCASSIVNGAAAGSEATMPPNKRRRFKYIGLENVIGSRKRVPAHIGRRLRTAGRALRLETARRKVLRVATVEDYPI